MVRFSSRNVEESDFCSPRHPSVVTVGRTSFALAGLPTYALTCAAAPPLKKRKMCRSSEEEEGRFSSSEDDQSREDSSREGRDGAHGDDRNAHTGTDHDEEDKRNGVSSWKAWRT